MKLQENREKLELELKLLNAEKSAETLKLDRYNELYAMGRYDRQKYDKQYNASTEQLNKIGIAITKVQEQLTEQETIKQAVVNQELSDYDSVNKKFRKKTTTIDKESLHRVIKAINVSMSEGKQSIEVLLINGNTFII